MTNMSNEQGPDEIFGDGVGEAAPATAPPAPDDDNQEFLAALMAGTEAESEVAAPAPEPEPVSEQQFSQPQGQLVDPAVLAQAAALGIPPADLFRHDPANIPAFVQSVAAYSQQVAAQRQASQVAAPPPQFDLDAAIEKYREQNFDEIAARNLAEKDKRLHDIEMQVGQLRNVVHETRQQHAQNVAVQAVGEWNNAIHNALLTLPPQFAAIAGNPDSLGRVQAQSQTYARMLQATGQPIPDAATLAQRAAFEVFGTSLIGQGAPYASPVPRPRGGATSVNAGVFGKDRAISFIDGFFKQTQ
jgi:hypothetical protein